MRGKGQAGQAMLEYVVGLLLVALVVGAAIRRLETHKQARDQRIERHYADGRN